MNSGLGYLKRCEKTVAATHCHRGFDNFDTWFATASQPRVISIV